MFLFWSQLSLIPAFYFCNISEISVKFILNALESSFVRIHCILKYGHKLLLFQDFDPIQIAFVFPKLGLNPVYFEKWKTRSKAAFKFYCVSFKNIIASSTYRNQPYSFCICIHLIFLIFIIIISIISTYMISPCRHQRPIL